jgi:3-oxoacyl-ACP reductase-like protein
MRGNRSARIAEPLQEQWELPKGMLFSALLKAYVGFRVHGSLLWVP